MDQQLAIAPRRPLHIYCDSAENYKLIKSALESILPESLSIYFFYGQQYSTRKKCQWCAFLFFPADETEDHKRKIYDGLLDYIIDRTENGCFFELWKGTTKLYYPEEEPVRSTFNLSITCKNCPGKHNVRTEELPPSSMEEYFSSFVNLYGEITDFGDEGRTKIAEETVVDKTYGIDVKLEESKKVVKDVYGEIKEDDELNIAVANINIDR